MRTSKYAQSDRDDRNISVGIDRNHVYFTLEPLKKAVSAERRQREPLRLAFGMATDRKPIGKCREDTSERLLEDALADILVEILTELENSYRQGLIRHRDWMIKQRAEIEEELRQKKIEEERKATERRQKEEKERIDQLLAQAAGLHQAETIRTYVRAARDLMATSQIPAGDIERWASWALNEADRIDPIKNGILSEVIQSVGKAS
jgi:hypothetical protein